MADVLETHTAILLREIDRLKALYPELEDDPQLLADTVEGSTRAEWVLDRLSVAYNEAVALREATAMLIETLKARHSRFDRRSEGVKDLMLAVMRSAGMKKIVLPSATLSIASGKAKLDLDDDFHAQGYMRVKTEPMRADILAALQAGDAIPGARLVQSPDHLQVRTK